VRWRQPLLQKIETNNYLKLAHWNLNFMTKKKKTSDKKAFKSTSLRFKRKKVVEKKGSRRQPPLVSTNLNLAEVWPQERDFMERPDRYRYIRKLIKPKGCVFCSSKNQGLSLESLMLYCEEHAMVVLNKYPYNNGHTLVIPTRHCGNVVELSEEEFLALSFLLRRTIGILQKSYSCPGLNIGLNHGSVAGAGIPGHLHWHVIPRWRGDTNFFPLIGETKVLAETVDQTYERLRPYFEDTSHND